MTTKTAGVANLGAEEVAQAKAKVTTRAENQAFAETLFSEFNAEKARTQRKYEGLFVQTPGAETMAPLLAKTAAIDAFFTELEESQLSEAQRRYPELRKAAAAPGGRGTFVAPKAVKPGVAPTTSLSGRAP